MINRVVFIFLFYFYPLKCFARICPPLPILDHGKYVRISEGKVRVECHPSYEYNNAFDISRQTQIITCYKSGQWDDPKPNCSKKHQHCLPPSDIDHGFLVGDPPYPPGSEVYYRCNEGYKIVGPSKLICKYPQYFWNDNPPECIKIKPPLQVVAENIGDNLVDKLTKLDVGRVIHGDVEYLGLDLFLAFDKSNSISPQQFLEGIKFAKFLIKQFNVSNSDQKKVGGTRLAVYTFGNDAKEEINLTDTTITSTKAAINKLDLIRCSKFCDGATNMADALKKIGHIAPKQTRKEAKKVLFMTSDGVPTADPKSKDVTYYTNNLKKLGFEIYTVGIGQDIDEQLLKDLSSTPIEEHMFLLEKFKDFAEIMDLIRNGTTEPPPPLPEQCGYIAENFYKTRNLETGLAKLGNWPWLAAIIVKDYTSGGSRFACSGILICEEWVLTTAQCVTDDLNIQYEPENVYVVVGEDNFEKLNDKEQLFYAVKIIRHPNFIHNKTKVRNDIALIQLNTKAEINDYVRTACILQFDFDHSSKPGEVGYMIGWLISSEEQVRIPQEPVKVFQAEQVEMKVNGLDNCEIIKPPQYLCDDSIINAHGRYESDKTCSGYDKGSPFLMSQGKRMAAVGLASHVKGCTLQSKTGFFTRISSYYDWIRENSEFCSDNHQ
uniref:C3/C5 convertase n=1 Tax=Scolopendra japonica TaxID=2609777 RepID=A0A0E3VMY3_9MYRI|nr:complement factor B-2 [Scolopendra japonica]